MFEKLPDRLAGNAHRFLFENPAVTNGTEFAWFEYQTQSGGGHLELSADFLRDVAQGLPITPTEVNRLWAAMAKKSGGDLETHWIPETLLALSPMNEDPPDVAFVPAIRRIASSEEASGPVDLSGAG